MLTEEQKLYLKDKFGIDVDNAKRSFRGTSDRQVVEAYRKFYEEKEKVLAIVTQELASSAFGEFAQPRVDSFLRRLASEDESTKSQMESTGGENEQLNLLLKNGKKTLKELEDEAKKDVSNAKEFVRRRAKIVQYVDIIRDSPISHDGDLLGFANRIKSAVQRDWKNGEGGDAVDTLKEVESEAKTLSEKAVVEKRQKQQYEERRVPAENNLAFLQRTIGADDTKLKIMVNIAKSQAQVEDYSKAYDALANHEKVYKEAYKAAEKLQQKNSVNAASQDEVTRRIDELEQFFLECEQKIGLGGWVAEKRSALAEIVELKNGQQFTEALEKLTNKKDWDLASLRSDSEKVTKKRVSELEKDSVSFSAIQGIESQLATYKDVATDSALAKETKEFVEIQNGIITGKITSSFAGFFTMHDRLRDETKRLEDLKQECVSLANAVISRLEQLDDQSLGSKLEKAGYRGEFERYNVGLEQRKFDQVKPLFESLKLGLDNFIKQQSEAKVEWTSRESAYQKLEGGTGLQADLDLIDKCFITTSMKTGLSKEQAEIEMLATGKNPDYVLATERFEVFSREVKRVLGIANNYRSLEEKRNEFDGEVQDKIKLVEAKITEVKQLLEQRRNRQEATV